MEDNKDQKTGNVFSNVSNVIDKLASSNDLSFWQDIVLIIPDSLHLPSLQSGIRCRRPQHGHRTSRYESSLNVAGMRRRNSGCIQLKVMMLQR